MIVNIRVIPGTFYQTLAFKVLLDAVDVVPVSSPSACLAGEQTRIRIYGERTVKQLHLMECFLNTSEPQLRYQYIVLDAEVARWCIYIYTLFTLCNHINETGHFCGRKVEA